MVAEAAATATKKWWIIGSAAVVLHGASLPEVPPRAPRSVAPKLFYRALVSEGEAAGVTRLADITRLDRIGFPVWQAVHPSGRRQSVHRGKGWRELDAKIGALCEALESHWAESVQPDRPRARWDELPAQNRCPRPSDCYSDPAGTVDPGSIDWCTAIDRVTGCPIYLPHLFVSLDFSLRRERHSSGAAPASPLVPRSRKLSRPRSSS